MVKYDEFYDDIDKIDPTKIRKSTKIDDKEKYRGLLEISRKGKGNRLIQMGWDFHVLFTYIEEDTYSGVARKLGIGHVETVKRAIMRATKDLYSHLYL